jgi:hypothetical protein
MEVYVAGAILASRVGQIKVADDGANFQHKNASSVS